MPSKPKPYLRLVWPPAATEEELADSSFILLRALENDGWRSVSIDDMRNLPPDMLCIIHGYMINGRVQYFLKPAPKALSMP
jgi:hypothetical protein